MIHPTAIMKSSGFSAWMLATTDWSQIVTVVLGFLGTSLTAYLTFRLAMVKVTAEKAAAASEKAVTDIAAAKLTITETKAKLEEKLEVVRHEVNGMRHDLVTAAGEAGTAQGELKGRADQRAEAPAAAAAVPHVTIDVVHKASDKTVEALTAVTKETGQETVSDITDVINDKKKPNEPPKTP